MKNFSLDILFSNKNSSNDILKESDEEIMANLDKIPEKFKQILLLDKNKDVSISSPTLQKRIEALESALADIILIQAKEE